MTHQTNLQDKIKLRLDESKLSIRNLERLAGLKRSAVSNILEGKSKSPSLNTLRAIANVLHCSLSDLLEESELETTIQLHSGLDVTQNHLNLPVKLPLLHETMDIVDICFKKIEYNPNIEQFWHCVKRVYSYTLGSGDDKIDVKFAEWLVNSIVPASQCDIARARV